MPLFPERFVSTGSPFRGCCVIVAPETVKIETVTKVSTIQKLRVVARVAAERARRSRTVGALMKAAGTATRSLGFVLHQLWLEVTGAVFLAMAAMGGIVLAREYAKYAAGKTTATRVVVAICFTLTFAWFGVTSFWRVRQKTRDGAR